jgi:hypothetical protein
MKILMIALALCSSAFADTAVPFGGYAAPGQPYWFRTYPTAPYREIWSAEILVKDLDASLPMITAAVQKGGGALTQPLERFISSRTDKTQQVTFSVPGKKAKALVKALRKLGDISEPAVSPQGAPIPIDEVHAKIAKILKEKTEHAAELAKVPAAAAAEEEILEHLMLVEDVAKRADTDVRLNLLVKQK